MHPVERHRLSCAQQRACALQRLSETSSSSHRRQHAAAALMLAYGVEGYGRRAFNLLGKDGTPKPSKVDRSPASHRIHLLRPLSGDPQAAVDNLCQAPNHLLQVRAHMSDADWEKKTKSLYVRRIDRQIAGCKRALWLYALWMGLDVSTLRTRWYHPEEFMGKQQWRDAGRPVGNHTDYWRWAWACMNNGRTLENLQGYLNALVARRAELTDTTTSGAAFAAAFTGLMDQLDGVAA